MKRRRRKAKVKRCRNRRMIMTMMVITMKDISQTNFWLGFGLGSSQCSNDLLVRRLIGQTFPALASPCSAPAPTSFAFWRLLPSCTGPAQCAIYILWHEIQNIIEMSIGMCKYNHHETFFYVTGS